MFKLSTSFSTLALLSLALAAPLKRKRTDYSSPAIDVTTFAADSSIDVASIYSAAKSATGKKLASYPTSTDKGATTSHIYGDWMDLDGVSAIHFIADMDVDCDGVAYKCPGNPDGQSETSFGALDATKVPFFVLPLKFTDQQKDSIKPNALGAVVCDGKMFYGIYGDQNGDDPEVIGEASLLLAQACFPKDKMSGDNGHVPADVLYIVFGSKVPEGVEKETIDIDKLKQLGDEQVKLLQSALNAGGPSGTNSSTSSLPTATGTGDDKNDDRRREVPARKSYGRRRTRVAY